MAAAFDVGRGLAARATHPTGTGGIRGREGAALGEFVSIDGRRNGRQPLEFLG